MWRRGLSSLSLGAADMGPGHSLWSRPGHCGVWSSLPGPHPLDARNSPVVTTTDVPRHGQVSPGGRITRVRPCCRGSNSCLSCPRCHGKHHVACSPESELQPTGRGFQALWAAAGAPLAGFCAGPHNYMCIIYALCQEGGDSRSRDLP